MQIGQLLKRQADISSDILNCYVTYRIFRDIEDNNNPKFKSIHDTYYDLARVMYDCICINCYSLIADESENIHYIRLITQHDPKIMDHITNELHQLGLSTSQKLEDDLKQILEKKSGVVIDEIVHELKELGFYRNEFKVHTDDCNPEKQKRTFPLINNIVKLTFEILRFILKIKTKLLNNFDLNQCFIEYIDERKKSYKQKLMTSFKTLVIKHQLKTSLPDKNHIEIVEIFKEEDSIKRLIIRQKGIAEEILRYYAKYKFLKSQDSKLLDNIFNKKLFNSLILNINILFGDDEKNNCETHYLRLSDKMPNEINGCANKLKISSQYNISDQLNRIIQYFLNINSNEIDNIKSNLSTLRKNIAHANNVNPSKDDEKNLETMVKFSFGIFCFLDMITSQYPNQPIISSFEAAIQMFEEKFKNHIPILVELLDENIESDFFLKL